MTPLQVGVVSRWSESELNGEINLAVAADTNVGKCGVGRERVGTDMVGRLGIWMVGMATVAVEEIDCSYVVAFAAAAAARLRWGRCARSCKYNRCHCNNVGLPTSGKREVPFQHLETPFDTFKCFWWLFFIFMSFRNFPKVATSKSKSESKI